MIPSSTSSAATVALAVLASGAGLGAARAQEAADAPKVLAQGAGFVISTTGVGANGAYALREEVTTPALIKALGGRSATAELTVDCAHRQSALGAVHVYPQSGAAGTATPVKAGVWMRSAPVDLFDLTGALCSGAAPAPALIAAPALAPADPAPPAAAPQPAAPQAAEPPVPPPPTTTADAAERHWVQVGAFATAALAEAQGVKLLATGTTGATGRRVEPVVRSGTTLYRLLLGPYPAKAQAQAACAALTKVGGACIVR